MLDEKRKNRLLWVDVLKGFAIFLVVFGHKIKQVDNYNSIILVKYIYSFHMPMFFVISGMLFTRKDSFSEYLNKKIKSLLIPYFSFATILFSFWVLMKLIVGNFMFNEGLTAFLGIFYGQSNYMVWGSPLWFVLCLFVVSCVFYVISKYNKRTIGFILVASGIVGYFCSYLPFRLPWMIDTALTAVVLYGIGYFSKELFLQSKKEYNYLNNIGILFLFIIGYIFNSLNTQIEMSDNYYGNVLFFFISALSTSFALFLLFKKLSNNRHLKNTNKIISYYGVNSLLVLAFHGTVATFLSNIFELIGIEYHTDSILGNLLISVISIILLIPVIGFINKYTPFLLGKKTIRADNFLNAS